jgi:hypothetical protein
MAVRFKMESATETEGEIVVHAEDGGAHDTVVEIKKQELLTVFGSETKVAFEPARTPQGNVRDSC